MPQPRPPPPKESQLAQRAKSEGKAVASSGASSLMEKPTSPPSLEALMSDSSLFKEPLLKDPDEEWSTR